MKTTHLRAALTMLACLLLLGPARAQDNNRPPDGFVPLFNGEDLTGWEGGTTIARDKITDQKQAEWDKQIAKHWSVDGIEIVSDGHGPHLATERDYGDFEFYVDWKLSKNGDSGIYLRGCPQVQLWDPTNEKAHKHGSDKGSGGLWNNQRAGRDPSQLADNPIGQWNRMYVRMVGPYVTVVLNGKTVVDNVPLENYYDRKKPVPMTGPIHLQTHGSETRFRNLFVREIPSEEANDLLAKIAGHEDEYRSIFNGENLEGWTGATDQYEVVDGAIRCKKGAGGNLITEKTYSDFAVRLEFKLPPGGNNGLAIRTPNAKVDPAHKALELQVLDDTHPKYAKLKDYQYHGSAYTVAPALRGYLRPVGEWNYQEVSVVGDHVSVDLNGYRILDVHLKQAKPDHASAKQTEGHFGFCGHNDPVLFRALRVKVIKGE
ncbi:MAG: DUF1080 domain-containing protein [Phycisphaeraceae bacterium]